MRVGDLVRCKSENVIFGKGVDDGTGLVIQLSRTHVEDNLSVHVQWAQESLWYEEKDLVVVSE